MWQDALYGPVSANDNISFYFRSRTLELEDLQQVLPAIDEAVERWSASTNTPVPSGGVAPAQIVWWRSLQPEDFEVLGRDVIPVALSAGQLGSLGIVQNDTQLRVRLSSGMRPSMYAQGWHPALLSEFVDIIESVGKPRVWWQRWPSAAPWLLLAAATVAGVVAALEVSRLAALAWLLAMVFLAVPARDVSQRWASRAVMSAPGFRFYDQPRAELRLTRANRNANLRAGAVGALPGAALGAAAALIAARIGGGG